MNLRNPLALLMLAVLVAACGTPSQDSDDHASHAHDDDHGDAHDDHDDDHADGPQRTRIDADIAQESGIRTAPVAPGIIADEHQVQGLITPMEGRSVQVTARFPGLVKRLDAGVGDSVRAGQRLAVIESNLSLSDYAVTAPMAGTVMERRASAGSVAGEAMTLYELADLSQLWVDLHIFGTDAGHIQAGAQVEVTRLNDGTSARTQIERVLPGTASASQSTVARAVLENGDGLWRPGAAVSARITVARAEVTLAVPLAAIQQLDGRDVVFVREGEEDYEARPVTLGRRDAQAVEVLDGLRAGEDIVVAQSYLVKADIGKAEVGHEH